MGPQNQNHIFLAKTNSTSKFGNIYSMFQCNILVKKLEQNLHNILPKYLTVLKLLSNSLLRYPLCSADIMIIILLLSPVNSTVIIIILFLLNLIPCILFWDKCCVSIKPKSHILSYLLQL